MCERCAMPWDVVLLCCGRCGPERTHEPRGSGAHGGGGGLWAFCRGTGGVGHMGVGAGYGHSAGGLGEWGTWGWGRVMGILPGD